MMKKLPDAEFDIMKVVWQLVPPVTSTMLMKELNMHSEKVWKLQTVHTLLGRLINRGFLKSEKTGKERFFTPLIGQVEYLQFETQSFVKQYHGNSLLNLVNTLYHGEELSDEDIAELAKWAKECRRING
ncbi:BlaI/MecI/CopY family transcriptional regulator [Candidatus Galacturonibacter soehngenii]